MKTGERFKFARLLFPHLDDSKLVDGFFYLSSDKSTSKHLCPCGCGLVVNLPDIRLLTADWITFSDDNFSLTLGVKNPCGSFYYIKESKLVWIKHKDTVIL